jgi:hypothetical protein
MISPNIRRWCGPELQWAHETSNGLSSLLPAGHSSNGRTCDVTCTHCYRGLQQWWMVRWYHRGVTSTTSHKMSVATVKQSPSPVAIETFCSTVKYSNEHMLGFMLILPPWRSRSKSCSWQSSPQQAAMASARAHSSCVIYALVKVGIYFPLYKKMLT